MLSLDGGGGNKSKGLEMRKEIEGETRPDTRPIPVADGRAGAEMRVFPLFDSITMDQPTDQPTNGRMNKASYRVASPRLKNGFTDHRQTDRLSSDVKTLRVIGLRRKM